MTQIALPRFQRAPYPEAAPEAGRSPTPFESVVCLGDRTSAGLAARQQAAALSGGGAVEHIGTPRPGRAGALLDRCDGADLLVLGARDDAIDLIERAELPVLLARGCPAGATATDRMLLAVDDHSDPRRAAEVVGVLAARHHGTVAVVRAPAPNRALERATAAASRIVLQTVGTVPQVREQGRRREHAIVAAAASMDATLLVLPLGSTTYERSTAASIARLVGCSVLSIPVAPNGPGLPRSTRSRHMADAGLD